MKSGRMWRSIAWVALALLGGCGGGGGGGGGGGAAALTGLAASTNTATNSASGAASAAPAGAMVTLSGTASFDSVPNDRGFLDYARVVSKPVRGASVEILDSAANVLATATTDDSGAYAAAVPANTTVRVRVKAQLLRPGSGPAWDVTVRDNTQGDAVYVMETSNFASGSADLGRDVHAPSGWDGSSYSAARVAAPFALLDTIYTAQSKLLSVAPSAVLPPLRIFWSSNNLPAAGDPALGQIGSTSFVNQASGRVIYVLGKVDVDTDEYDSPVVAHEWGHYYQSVFSRDDSPGGSHSMTDRLDRRVAFSEGWGDAWSGIALARSTYTDSVGPGQAQGVYVDLSAGAAQQPGWFSESSIQSIFWRLNAQVGFKGIHDTMSGPFRSGVAVTSIHPFAAAFAVAAPGSASALNNLLVAEHISAAPNDPFGQSETNDGGIGGQAGSLPMYHRLTVGTPTTACVTNAAGGDNKLGSYVYLRFNAPQARDYVFSVVGDASASPMPDPDFTVFQGGRIASSNAYGPSEARSVGLAAGQGVLAITDYNNSSAATCFTVTLQ